MFVYLRSGRSSRQIGVTNRAFTENDVGKTFTHMVPYGNNTAKAQELRVEGVDTEKHKVTVAFA